jgi:Ca2+-binding EF-hand superfamily protein
VILVSADGTLTRLDPETLKPSASAALPIPDPAEETKTGKETGNEILKRLDRDRDGRVSRKEWRGNSRIFDRIDKNSDGFLDRKEFEIMAKGTGRAPGRDPFQKPGREGPGRKGPGRKGPRRGGPQNSAPQEVSLCLTPSFLAVVKGGTLFVYARKTLTLLGHNRFARSVGTEKGRFPNPPRSAPVTIRAQEDTLFLFDGTRVLRINLKKLRVTKEFKLPASSQKPKTDAFETLDRNRDGVIDFDEFQGPPDLFRQADGNRDRVLDRKEVDRLPPDALLGMGRKDARSGKKGQLIVAGKVLLISNGNRVFRLDAKKLKLLSERTLKK